MRKRLYRGREIKTKIWRFGYYAGIWKFDDNEYAKIIDSETAKEYYVEIETVGRNTDLADGNGENIFEGDIVQFLDSKGLITNEVAAFGICFDNTINWDKIEKEIPIYTGCNNCCSACYNDNFISLWEIFWNFNEYENLEIIEVIGNIHDNPELLEESK